MLEDKGQDGLYPIAPSDRKWLAQCAGGKSGRRLLDMRARQTGEIRAPKKGEWYLSGAIVEAYYAVNNVVNVPQHIAEIVETETFVRLRVCGETKPVSPVAPAPRLMEHDRGLSSEGCVIETGTVRLVGEGWHLEVHASNGGLMIRAVGSVVGSSRLIIVPECANGVFVTNDVTRESVIHTEALHLHDVWKQNEKEDVFNTKGKKKK